MNYEENEISLDSKNMNSNVMDHLDTSDMRYGGNTLRNSGLTHSNNEALLEYLESTLGVRKSLSNYTKANESSISLQQYKQSYDKNYFEGLTQWIDGILTNLKSYYPLNQTTSTNISPSSNTNSSNNTSPTNDHIEFFRGFQNYSISSRMSTEGPVSRHEHEYSSQANQMSQVNQANQTNHGRTNTLSTQQANENHASIHSEDNILGILQVTEDLIYSISNAEEDENDDTDNITDNNDNTSNLTFGKIKEVITKVLDCIYNIEITISWVKYHIYQNDLDGSSPDMNSSRTSTKHSQNILNTIVRPKQLDIYAYRIIQLVERIGKLRIWQLMTTTDKISNMSDEEVVYISYNVLRLLRMIIYINEIQSHINLISLCNPTQHNHLSRHIPSTIPNPNMTMESTTMENDIYSSSHSLNILLQAYMDIIKTLYNNIQMRVAPIILQNTNTTGVGVGAGYGNHFNKGMAMDSVDIYDSIEHKLISASITVAAVIQDIEAICITTDLLSYCHISSITGQHYNASNMNINTNLNNNNNNPNNNNSNSNNNLNNINNTMNMSINMNSSQFILPQSSPYLTSRISHKTNKTHTMRKRLMMSSDSDSSSPYDSDSDSDDSKHGDKSSDDEDSSVITDDFSEDVDTIVARLQLPLTTATTAIATTTYTTHTDNPPMNLLPSSSQSQLQSQPPSLQNSPNRMNSSNKSMKKNNTNTNNRNKNVLNAIQIVELIEKSMNLIASLPTPSLIRSKLCYGACRYLEYMRKNKLIWQIYASSNSKFLSTKLSIEKQIVMLYEQAFEVSNKGYEIQFIEQLLMFESAADLIQTSKDMMNMSSICVQLPIIFDLSKRWTDISPSSSSSSLLSNETFQAIQAIQPLDSYIRFYQNQDVIIQLSLVLSYFSRLVIDKSSYHAFTLLDLCFQIIRRPNHGNMIPSTNLTTNTSHSDQTTNNTGKPGVTSKVSFTNLITSNRSNAIIKLKREVLLLASKNQDHERIIESALFILERLTSIDVQIVFDENISEIKFLIDLVCKAYLDIGYYEKAVQIIHEYIRFLTHRLNKAITALDSSSSKYHLALEKLFTRYHKLVDPIILRIGQIYLDASLPYYAAIELQRYLEVLVARRVGHTYELKLSTLSWLLQAYLDMNNTEICKKIVTLIKNLRNDMSITNPNSSSNLNQNSNVKPTTIDTKGNLSSLDLNYDTILSIGNMNNESTGQFNLSIDTNVTSSNRISVERPNRKTSPKSSPVGGSDMSNYPMNLPKTGVIQYNLDLGEATARIHQKSQGYIAALKSLTPTIIGIEVSSRYLQALASSQTIDSSKPYYITPNFITSLSEAKRELARLYYFRGEIQLEAAKSPIVKYPFTIGSSQLYDAIYLVYEQMGLAPTSVKRKSISVPSMQGSSMSLLNSPNNASNIEFEVSLSCRMGMQYKTPSDLLWDAMKWFERAWEFYESVNHPIEAAKAADRVAQCHLEALYVPSVFFQKPKELSSDLGSAGSAAMPVYANWDGEDDENHLSPGLRQVPRQSSLELQSIPRKASMDEVQRATDYCISISTESFLPVCLLESYLSMAELKLIQDESFEAIAYWWEARELFFHLFVDGATVPILRRASVSFALRLSLVVDRLVRFLWACERSLLNQNLVLLDIHILCSYEIERIQKQAINRSNKVSVNIDTLLDTIRSTKSPTHSQSSPSLDYLSTGMLPAEYEKSLNAWSAYCQHLNLNLNQTLTSTQGIISPMSSIGTTGVVLERIASFPCPDIPLTLPLPMLSSTSVSNPNSSRMMNSNSPRSNITTSPRAASHTRDSRSLDGTIEDILGQQEKDLVKGLNLYTWVLDNNNNSSSSSGSGEEDDDFVVENMWRCFVLVAMSTRKEQASRSPSPLAIPDTLASIKSVARKALCSLSLIMRHYRYTTRQYDGKEISFDSLTRTFVRKATVDEFLRLDGSSTAAMNTAKKCVMMQERMQHIVYCLKVDELLMMYRPYSGTQYIQPFGGSGYITYAERSQAWLLTQANTFLTRSSSRSGRKGSSLGPGVEEIGDNIGIGVSGTTDDVGFSMNNLVGEGIDLGPSFGSSSASLSRQSTDNSTMIPSSIIIPPPTDSIPLSENTTQQAISDPYNDNNDDNDELESGFGNISDPANNTSASAMGRTRLNRSISKSSRSIQSGVSNQTSSSPNNGPSLKTSHPIPPEFLSGPPTSGSYPSYASIASSTASARVPKTSTFSSQQSKFIFDLAVEGNDAMCGGGVEGRRNLLEQLREVDFLRGALEFIKDAEYDPITPGDESSGTSSSIGKRQIKTAPEDSRRFNAFLPAGLLRMFQTQKSDPPPAMSTSITLICSKTTGAIPWENLAGPYGHGMRGPHGGNQLILVRQSTLMTMYGFVKVKGGNYLTGPSWNQAPIYLSIAQGINGLPVRQATDVKVREYSRRIVTSIQAIETMTHKVSHLVRASKDFIVTSAPVINPSHDDIHKRYSIICQSYQDRIWPLPSALLPLGKVSGQSLRSRRLKKILFYDLSTNLSHGTVRDFLNWIDMSNTMVTIPAIAAVNATSFPLVILTYTDLLEMSEAVTALTMTRGNAVIIFAPHFCQGTVAKEIVRSLDTWCAVASTVISSSSSNSSTLATPTAPSSATGSLSLLSPINTSLSNQSTPSHFHFQTNHTQNTSLSQNQLILSHGQSFSTSSTTSSLVGVRARENSQSSVGSIPSNHSQEVLVTQQSQQPQLTAQNRPDSPSTVASSNATTVLAGRDRDMVISVNSVYEPTEVDLNSKTLIYHAIMDTVTKLQNELAVPICVFI